MKVLDPQTAHLPLPELHAFLSTHHAKPRPKDKQIGTYPAVNLTGLNAVTKDLRSYLTDVAPHVGGGSGEQVPVEEWMGSVVEKLRGEGLVRGEVVQLLNLGVGAKGGEGAEEMDGDGEEGEQVNGEANGVEEGSGEMASINETLFRLVVEDSEERFPGEEGEAKIHEILEILPREVKRGAVKAKLNGNP